MQFRSFLCSVGQHCYSNACTSARSASVWLLARNWLVLGAQYNLGRFQPRYLITSWSWAENSLATNLLGCTSGALASWQLVTKCWLHQRRTGLVTTGDKRLTAPVAHWLTDNWWQEVDCNSGALAYWQLVTRGWQYQWCTCILTTGDKMLTAPVAHLLTGNWWQQAESTSVAVA